MKTRLQRVTDFLNERGYLSHWERASDDAEDGYLLHKCNCPYAGISGQHPELCLMDQVLIDDLFGQACQRTQSMAQNAHCCTYQVGIGSRSEIALDEIALVG